jgi:ABC-2 type transport system ATP-binding protein
VNDQGRAATTPALVATGVEKAYGELVALAPLNLTIRAGERVVLIGHNGSGKTTFLRMATGLLEPSAGTIAICGHDAGSLPARSALAYVADNPIFYDDLSVWEHLELVARLHGVADWQQRAADLLGQVGLYERADDLPVTFSRGLKQKAALTLAFIRPFKLLMVDEPFVGLDASGKEALVELLNEATNEGKALLVATHELSFVSTAKRCLALRDGRVEHDGPPDGLDVVGLVT